MDKKTLQDMADFHTKVANEFNQLIGGCDKCVRFKLVCTMCGQMPPPHILPIGCDHWYSHPSDKVGLSISDEDIPF